MLSQYDLPDRDRILRILLYVSPDTQPKRVSRDR